MHSTKRFLLKKGLGLTCVTNTQCKTSCLSAMFQLPLNSEGRSLSALLPYVLRVSCRDFPGQQAVAAQLDELYGARVEPIIRKRGEAQLIGFAADVIDEHFAMRGDTDLFANTAQMMARILLHPGEFTAENVAREAAQLCARIAALPDDKRTWAVRRMYQYLCDEEAFRLVELGDIEEIRRAAPEQLAEQYQKILQTAPLELFYCGSLDADQAAQTLAQAFAERPEIDQLITPKTQGAARAEARAAAVYHGRRTCCAGKADHWPAHRHHRKRSGISGDDCVQFLFRRQHGIPAVLPCARKDEPVLLCLFPDGKDQGRHGCDLGHRKRQRGTGSHRDFAPIGGYSGGRLDAGGSGQRQALDLCVAAHHV